MKGASSAQNRLAALPNRARAALNRAAADAARAAAAAAKNAAPVRTGALRASIAASPLPHGAQAAASVPYAVLVEQRSPYMGPAAAAGDFTARAARALEEVLR